MNAINVCIHSHSKLSVHEITHLITVSCTGMYAPGLDIDIVKVLGLNKNIQRTCINFMGCYAAFNAIKIGDAICKSYNHAKVLIVCTELCSLHFQKAPTEDNILANALFADGSAAMIIENTPTKTALSIDKFYNTLSFTEQEHMAWSIGNFGFEMKLSAYVPEIIKSGIRKITTEMLQQVNKTVDDIQHYAIHPGGKKILEAVEQVLGIPKIKNQAAHSVLSKYGNMSSATILFVLELILKNSKKDDHQSNVLSFAFGPGLTLESILFTLHHEA